MSVSVSKPLSPKIPIGFSDRQQAESFFSRQKYPPKAKQVYLNTLAILAVKFHLECWGFSPDWTTCDSFDPLTQSLFDVADLDLPNLGKIECRPILPNQMAMYVPPEVSTNRLAYVGIGLNRELTEAEIIGFVTELSQEMVLLSQLRSPDELIDWLHQCPPTFPTTRLSDWLENTFTQGWKSLAEIFADVEQQFAWNFRSVHSSQHTVKRGKIFNLERQGYSFALLVEIQPTEDEEINICIVLYATRDQSHLPAGLKLNILDEDGISVMEALSRETQRIQMEFKGEIGEAFQVKISGEEMVIIESFVI